MRTGAVITAAGRSSRMGSFKPLLKIGNFTVVEHIIRNFQTASIKNIVIITGNKAEELENNLKYPELVFLRNNMYECSEMLDSIKIGLDYLKDKCEKIFVSPVDIPLFTADTVEALLFCKTAVGIPTYKGRTGHPVILGNDAVFKILMYSGNGGLRKVITELSLEIDYIETKDKGILCDIDTKEDYTGILKLYSEQYGKDKE